MKRRLIYDSDNFAIRADTFKFDVTGESRDITFVDQPGVAIGIPLQSDGRIILVEQWRPLIGQVLLECPGGKIKQGESPEEALGRELSEEIGFRPRRTSKLGDFFSSVGVSTERIHVFVASDLTSTPRRAKDEKDISLRYFTRQQLEKLLRTSMFPDGKTQIALTAYLWGLPGAEES